jgi:hypothetical protein
MEPVILMNDVLNEMDSGKPFKMSFVTADRKKGTGGELKEVINWAKVMGIDDDDRLAGQIVRSGSKSNTRKPDHFRHRTFNIYNPNDPHAHIVKVHWRLILFFNNKRVIN